MLLRVQTNKERGHVNNLLTNADVSLGDEHTSVVNGLGQTKLEHLGLETSLQEILNAKSKHIIELHAVLVKHTDTNQTSNQSVTLKQTLGVLLISGKKVTGSTTNLGKLESHSVDLVLVLETVLSSELQLGIETGSIVWALGHRIGLRVLSRSRGHLVVDGSVVKGGTKINVDATIPAGVDLSMLSGWDHPLFAVHVGMTLCPRLCDCFLR